jgi:hypothetical protein
MFNFLKSKAQKNAAMNANLRRRIAIQQSEKNRLTMRLKNAMMKRHIINSNHFRKTLQGINAHIAELTKIRNSLRSRA